MNNDNKGGCLAIVLGGILFILGPIVVILSGLISAPIGMKVFLLAWIIAVVLCNTFISDKSTRITLSIIPTVIYAFSFAAWYADDVLDGYYGGGGLGDTIGMFLLACATLVPLMLIGQAIRSTLEQKSKRKKKRKLMRSNKKYRLLSRRSSILKCNFKIDEPQFSYLIYLETVAGKLIR